MKSTVLSAKPNAAGSGTPSGTPRDQRVGGFTDDELDTSKGNAELSLTNVNPTPMATKFLDHPDLPEMDDPDVEAEKLSDEVLELASRSTSLPMKASHPDQDTYQSISPSKPKPPKQEPKPLKQESHDVVEPLKTEDGSDMMDDDEYDRWAANAGSSLDGSRRSTFHAKTLHSLQAHGDITTKEELLIRHLFEKYDVQGNGELDVHAVISLQEEIDRDHADLDDLQHWTIYMAIAVIILICSVVLMAYLANVVTREIYVNSSQLQDSDGKILKITAQRFDAKFCGDDNAMDQFTAKSPEWNDFGTFEWPGSNGRMYYYQISGTEFRPPATRVLYGAAKDTYLELSWAKDKSLLHLPGGKLVPLGGDEYSYKRDIPDEEPKCPTQT